MIAYYSNPGAIIDSWSGCLEDDGAEFIRRNYTVTDAGYYSMIEFNEDFQRLFFLPSTACHDKGLDFVKKVIKVLKNHTLTLEDIQSKMKHLRDEICLHISNSSYLTSEVTFIGEGTEVINSTKENQNKFVDDAVPDEFEKTTKMMSQSSTSKYLQSTVLVTTSQIITSIEVSTSQTTLYEEISSTLRSTPIPTIKYNFVNILTGNMSETDLNTLVMSLFITCLVLTIMIICCCVSHFKCVKKVFYPSFYRKSNSICDFKRSYHDSEIAKISI